MSSGRSFFATGARGPASTWTTRKPGSICTTFGSVRRSARVNTSHSTPARASEEASARTYTFMPPPSPAPGCASGEVCTLNIATRRTDIGSGGAQRPPEGAGLGRLGGVLALPGRFHLERPVDLDEHLLLPFGD